MTPPTPLESQYLAELRLAFDQSFSAPVEAGKGDLVSLIAMRTAGELLALRSDQIGGIARVRRIVAVPSRIRELVGIMGMRGALVPVFNLASLLGADGPSGPCSWVALAHGESPAALAFEEFEGQVEVAKTCLYEAEGPPRRYVRQLAQIGAAVRAVIDVPSVVEAIGRTAGLQGADQ